jgi:carboxyl-terminal processing protease
MPDINIPVDTTAFNSFFYALRARGSLTEFMFNHLVKTYKPVSLNQIAAEFNLSDELYKRLVSIAAKSDVRTTPKAVEVAREAINNEIKALLAKFYFGEGAYFKVLNASDRVIARSLQELKQP